MFSVNIDKLVHMTPAESISFTDAAGAVLAKCEAQCRTVAVTGDGVSAFKLAYAISQKGKRVLFVDGDVKSEIFLLKYRLGKNLRGFTDYLANEGTIKDLICVTNCDSVDIMFTGDTDKAGDISAYTGSVVHMLAEALDVYDYVVVLADESKIAACCGGTVIIMKRSEYSEEAADDLTNELYDAGCYVMGVIIGE